MAVDNENNTESSQNNNDEAVSTAGTFWTSQFKARHPMETLLRGRTAAFGLREGDAVEGTVLEKKGTRVFLDLNEYGTGIIFGREFYAAQELIKNLKPGDGLSAKVVDSDNEEGFVELSLKEAGEEKKWAELKKIMREGEILELSVLEANRGGLILEACGVKGFLPASQLSAKNYPRVDGGEKERIFQELQKLVGGTLKVKILDLHPAENKLIFTEKGSVRGEAASLLAKYKIGDEVEGEITGVVDFGAFIRLDGTELEGLIHISEIDWSLVENPREILKAGQKVRAKIIDMQGDKISLSLKQLKENPWLKIAEKYKKGDLVKGKITKFNPFGAFVEIEPQIQALVHISEFGTEARMKEKLELGREYEFKILLVDPKEHRMSLGIISETKKNSEEAPVS